MKLKKSAMHTRKLMADDLPLDVDGIKNEVTELPLCIEYLGYTGTDKAIVLDGFIIPRIRQAVNCHDELMAAMDPEMLEAIADEIGGFCGVDGHHHHSARAHSLRVIAKKQRAAMAKVNED